MSAGDGAAPADGTTDALTSDGTTDALARDAAPDARASDATTDVLASDAAPVDGPSDVAIDDARPGFDGGTSEDVVDAGPVADVTAGTDARALADGPNEAESGGPTCSGGEILCNGTCVNPATDPNHCGACGVTCSSSLCGTSITADMSSSPAGWTFNGSAVWDSSGPSARMTAANAASATGTVIYGHSVVTDEFTASFQFRIGAGGGGRYDGMGFMIEASGPSAIGSGDGALGMGGLVGYGVEFDVYNNGQCADNSADHVGVDSLSLCSNILPTSLFASPDLTPVNLADGQWHAAVVSLSGGAMSVSIDAKPVAQNVALTGFTSGTSYYYGFSGATGGVAPNGGIQTEVKTVGITFPTPRCL